MEGSGWGSVNPQSIPFYQSTCMTWPVSTSMVAIQLIWDMVVRHSIQVKKDICMGPGACTEIVLFVFLFRIMSDKNMFTLKII